MPFLYFDNDKRQFFSAPQFHRMRHRYRGSRESAKVNLEIQQTNYSVLYLYSVLGSVLRRIAVRGFKMVMGRDYQVPAETNELYVIEDSAFKNVEDGFPLEYEGLTSLTTRIQDLQHRLNMLESR